MKSALDRILIKTVLATAALTALLVPGAVSASDNANLEFSGFARVIAGYLDTDQAYFEGYEEEISFTEKSLVGFQADYAITSEVSLSGQLLLHTDSQYQSGIEWLYLSYEPNPHWQFKAGRLRTPYLKYSDVFDVGYAYSWISPPRQLYGSYLFFPRYEGINARYRFNIKEAYIDIEGYYGDFSNDIYVNGINFNVNTDNMYGVIAEINYQGWQARVATFDAKQFTASSSALDDLQSGLVLAGFADLARYFGIDGSTEAMLFGLSYESLDWFFTSEYVDVESVVPIRGIRNYYFTVGRYLGDYQILLTYAKSDQSLTTFENTIPLGVNPLFDQLYTGVEEARARFPTDVLNSVTLSGRWDFSPSMAFKAEVSFLNGEPGKTSLFEIKPGEQSFDRKAVLYQFGVEWVF